MSRQDVKPKFEVEEVDETVTETHIVREDGRNIEKKVEVPYGFNVYFPAGHSMRVRTKEELQRLGFTDSPELVDMESGDTVAKQGYSLKKHVQRNTSKKTTRRNSATGSADANVGD